MENKLVPIEVNRRPSIGRLIKNAGSLVFCSIYNQGIKKLDKQETNIAISIINTTLQKYNEKNNFPFSKTEMAIIQKRFENLDVYTYSGDSLYIKLKYAVKEKLRGKKIEGRDTKGYILTPTGVLMLDKENWEKYKNDQNTAVFTKIVSHEGFHFLTNQRDNTMSKNGERITSEGADESFMVKAVDDGRFSVIEDDISKSGMAHYNFHSYSPYGYSAFVSLLNMVGVMVNENPEVSALNNDGKYVKAVNEKYGEDFLKTLIKRTNCLYDPDIVNKLRSEARYHMLVQNYVLRTISHEIVDNVKSPEDAIKRLKAFQAAEEWSARIVLKEPDEPPRKIRRAKRRIRFKPAAKLRRWIANRKELSAKQQKKNKEPIYKKPVVNFDSYYRTTYRNVIEKLEEKGYTNVEEALKECKYKEYEFNKLRCINYQNIKNGDEVFKGRVERVLDFAKAFYGYDEPTKMLNKYEIGMYKKIILKEDPSKNMQQQQQQQPARDLRRVPKFKYQPPTQPIAQQQQAFRERLQVKTAPQPPRSQGTNTQKNPGENNTKKRDSDDELKFGDF